MTVWGEEVGRAEDVNNNLGQGREGDGTSRGIGGGREWVGGVPCVMRGSGSAGEGASGDEGWVGGLNGLLKFNYPFGEEDV